MQILSHLAEFTNFSQIKLTEPNNERISSQERDYLTTTQKCVFLSRRSLGLHMDLRGWPLCCGYYSVNLQFFQRNRAGKSIWLRLWTHTDSREKEWVRGRERDRETRFLKTLKAVRATTARRHCVNEGLALSQKVTAWKKRKDLPLISLSSLEHFEARSKVSRKRLFHVTRRVT